MSKFQHDVMLKIVKIIDLVMITIPFALCWELYYSYQVYAKFGWKGNWAMIGLFAVLFFLLGKVYDAFWMSLQRISELIYGQVLAAMATDGILYIVICLMARRLCNLLPGIAAIAGQILMASIWARVCAAHQPARYKQPADRDGQRNFPRGGTGQAQPGGGRMRAGKSAENPRLFPADDDSGLRAGGGKLLPAL